MAEESPVSIPFTRLRKEIAPKNENSKVSLIPFDGSEAPEMERWFETDLEVGKHYYTNKGIADYPTFVNEIKDGTTSIFWRIQKGEEFSGFIHADQVKDDPNSFSIGVVIPEENRKKGLALAAVNTLIHHSKDNGLTKAIANIADDNVASIRLFERAGFRRTDTLSGTKSQWVLNLDKIQDAQ